MILKVFYSFLLLYSRISSDTFINVKFINKVVTFINIIQINKNELTLIEKYCYTPQTH